MEKITWNPFNQKYKEDPVSVMQELREIDPVHKGINGHWILSRYKDIKDVLGDDRFLAYDLPVRLIDHSRHSGSKKGFNKLASTMTEWILYQNPPIHTNHKNTIYKIWKQFNVERLIDETTHELLSKMANKGTIDFIDAFATPLPVTVVNSIVGLESIDKNILRDWSLIISNIQEPFSGLREFELATETLESSTNFLIDQIEIQRKNSKSDNFISAFLNSEKISDHEMVGILHLLFIAGIETTVTIFGNIVSYFMAHPNSLEVIKANPSRLNDSVDEVLRLNNAARYIARLASSDCKIGDKQVYKGDTIYLSLYAANHDPEVFENPDGFNLRERNPHLSFGYGAHHCLGAQLSKLEIQLFLKHVIDMGLTFEEAGKKKTDMKSVIFRRVLKLPIKVVKN